VAVSSPGVGVGVSAAQAEHLVDVTAATLRAAGVTAADRVLVTLTDDGVPAGATLTAAAVRLGATAAAVSPRGRTRVLRAVRELGPTTLVATPCGALDFLARVFLEFAVQPEDLGITRLLLGGEIPSPGAARQLSAELDCDVGRLLLDPFTGAALAHGRDQRALTLTDPALAARAALDRDALVAAGPDDAATAAELVVRTAGEGRGLRTGEVVLGPAPAGAVPPPTHTVGDHVLARGRWLSLPAVGAALAGIDGVAGWELDVSREGTLDRVLVTVALDRPGLVGDPMWDGRIREAVASVVPVRVECAVVGSGDGPLAADHVVDRRGHHLGVDRAAAATSVAAATA
jgi:phenylacetate-CoA ligase